MNVVIEQGTGFVSTFGSRVERERPAIVFVHGAAMDHTVWTPFARYFSRHGTAALAVDLPGHGQSEGPPLPSVEAMAAWLALLLDKMGVSGAALVGHSLGSLVVLDLACERPDLCTRLALVGTAAPMPVSDGLLEAALANEHAALDMINLWGHSPRAHLGGFATPGTWMLGAQLRLTERAAAGVLHADLSACNTYRRGLDAATKVAVPTLLVLGRHDSMTPPRAAADLQDALPDSRTVTLDSGHALMAERPNQVLDALREIAR